MAKQNCWEFKSCGRQPGGARAADLGVCPATTEMRVNGVNAGAKAGRACWAVTGTLCGGRVQGTFAMKVLNCQTCEFYGKVKSEEGTAFVGSSQILARLS
jgi:hypothetical protein